MSPARVFRRGGCGEARLHRVTARRGQGDRPAQASGKCLILFLRGCNSEVGVEQMGASTEGASVSERGREGPGAQVEGR